MSLGSAGGYHPRAPSQLQKSCISHTVLEPNEYQPQLQVEVRIAVDSDADTGEGRADDVPLMF